MASNFPQNKEQFLTISGVGTKKYESYGEDFIKIIKDYCVENEIDTSKFKKQEFKEEKKTDRYELTYNYYVEGLSLVEIAEKRGYTTSTIIEHLKRCQNAGHIVDWLRFVDDPKKEEKILAVIKEVGLDKLKLIKEALPEEISYDDIRLVILKNEL